jgi:clan AA aspartic protease
MTSVGRVVPNRGPIVRLSIQRPDDRDHEIEALLDTGFNGFLALPSSLIEAFSLPHLGREQVTLANGEVHFARKYEVTVRFAGTVQSVEVVEAGEPIVGMALLRGYNLRVQCVDGGAVRLETHSEEN